MGVQVFGSNSNTEMHLCNSYFSVIVQVFYNSELVAVTKRNPDFFQWLLDHLTAEVAVILANGERYGALLRPFSKLLLFTRSL